jgi:hypothetical protein
LRQGIIFREKALTFGSVAHHDGKACVGGALVGSTSAQRWLQKGRKDVELRKVPFALNPALDVYFNSLVNLGMFEETPDRPETDEEAEGEIAATTFDDVQLSPLGAQLAKAYDSATGNLECVRDISSPARRCSLRALKQFGRRGGLCEVMETSAPDRSLLRDIFFARTGRTDGSHGVRRQSLLLLLDLCRQLSADDRSVGEPVFGQSVYFGQCRFDDDEQIDISWPEPLRDIATRWRMFYFHQYMSVALEGLFAWVVTHASEKGVAGVSFGDMVGQLNLPVVRKNLSRLLERTISSSFGDSTPTDTIRLVDSAFTELDASSSRRLDDAIPLSSQFSEGRLEQVIREGTYLHDPAGLAVPMVLLAVTLVRYTQWEDSNYGQWLATAARDPYLDLVPPVLTNGLNRRFGRWWACRWSDLTEYVLTRYVVQQHQSLSYEKTVAGDRCLLQLDGLRVMSNAAYDTVGVGNPRFRSALQVLKDLSLLEDSDDEITELTKDGQQILRELLLGIETP